MQVTEVISMAFRTIRGNKLRTGITIAIISFGITALIGIITSIEAMNQSLYENFSTMGSNSFSIRYRERRGHFGGGESVKKRTKNQLKERKSNMGKVITYEQAIDFKERFIFPADVSISKFATGNATIFWKDKKTNPNVRVIGGDENYLLTSGYTLKYGRNFSTLDLQTGRGVAIIGSDIAKKFFENNPSRAVGEILRINGNRYLVIGILKERGASTMLSLDNIIITTVNNVRRLYNFNGSCNISISVRDFKLMDAGISEATGLFRIVRKLDIKEQNNFFVDRSDSIVELFKQLLKYVRYGAVFIGLITLIGAAIGLMNIMLVAVSERTREIGLTKAIGAKSQTIRLQFLFEAILICLIGAFLGILAGIFLGNMVGIFVFKTSFVMPWLWVVLGVAICTIVGLAAGLYPALRAGKLDPIVALRYE